jgi:hypothetical protein
MCAIVAMIVELTCLAQDFPYRIERVSVDYRGAVANDRAILCYGNHGVITASYDRGTTWQQLSIGERYDIYYIQRWRNMFAGVHRGGIMWSNDDGRHWQIHIIAAGEDVVAGCGRDSIVYVLLRDRVMQWNLERNSIELFVELDTSLQWIDIACTSRYLYVMATDSLDNFIVRGIQYDRLEMLQDRYFGSYHSAVHLSVANDTLYALCEPVVLSREVGDYFLASSSLFVLPAGRLTTKRVAFIRMRGSAYLVEGNVVRYLGFTPEGNFQLRYYETILDSTRDFQPTAVVGVAEDRVLPFSLRRPPFKMTRIVRIGNSGDSLLAVGENKIIVISTDGGSTWRWCSIFYYNYYLNLAYQSPVYSDSWFTVFTSPGYTYYSLLRSKDGLTTFVPQRRWLTGSPSLSNILWHFEPDGRGFIQYGPNSRGVNLDSALAVTTDYAETFEWRPSITRSSYGWGSATRPLRLGDTFLVVGRLTRRDTVNNTVLINSSTILYRYSAQLESVDTVVVQNRIPLLMQSFDGRNAVVFLCCDTLQSAQGDTLYSHTVLLSTDAGSRWETRSRLDLSRQMVGAGIAVERNDGGKIYFRSSWGAIYVYRYRDNVWDTIMSPSPNDLDGVQIAFFDRKLWLLGAFDTTTRIYYYDLDRRSGWDSLTLSEHLSGWYGWSLSNDLIGSMAMMGIVASTDSALFISIGKRVWKLVYDGDLIPFEMEILRITRASSIVSVDQDGASRDGIEDIHVYPQPVRRGEQLRVVAVADVEAVEVWTLDGRRVVGMGVERSGEVAGVSMDVPAGVYVVEVRSSGGRQQRGLVMVMP